MIIIVMIPTYHKNEWNKKRDVFTYDTPAGHHRELQSNRIWV